MAKIAVVSPQESGDYPKIPVTRHWSEESLVCQQCDLLQESITSRLSTGEWERNVARVAYQELLYFYKCLEIYLAPAVAGTNVFE